MTQRRAYEIRDTAGELQAVHGRRDKLIGKDLWWRLPDGTTGLGGRKTKTLPLYRSQHIAGTTATAVCIVEGEKATDALAGAVPTVLTLGTVTGASSAPDAEVLQPVIDTGLPVYLWPDRDDEGAKHMQRVAALIPGALVIVDAPPDTKGADAADWARLTDRPLWESLAAAAVAPGDVVADAPAPPGREWALIVSPKETPLAECFDAALDVLGVKVRRNLRSGANEVHGVASTEPVDPDGWAPLTDDGAAALFAKIEGAVGVPAWRAPAKPWRVGDKHTRTDLVRVAALTRAVDPLIAWFDTLPYHHPPAQTPLTGCW